MFMNKSLHIVCLDVPWPPDYGGAIDMFYRIVALYKQGIKIKLHYFSYNNRGVPTELNQYCERIFVYDRAIGLKGVSATKPYIVSSRINGDLIHNLNKDRDAVLLEGIHCTGFIPEIKKEGRKIVVRVHNVESLYYGELARVEKNLFKKTYFFFESRLLKKYQKKLPVDCAYACLSHSDMDCLKKNYQLPHVFFLAAFTGWMPVFNQKEIGSFCLYQANLSVAENRAVAMWLLVNVFTKVRLPFVIAGKNPGSKLRKAAALCQHTCLIENPSDTEMDDLIQKAQVNILPSLNKKSTGIRLKLLHALFHGRHVVANHKMLDGSGLDALCNEVNDMHSLESILKELYTTPFSQQMFNSRVDFLTREFHNEKNAKELLQWL